MDNNITLQPQAAYPRIPGIENIGSSAAWYGALRQVKRPKSSRLNAHALASEFAGAQRDAQSRYALEFIRPMIANVFGADRGTASEADSDELLRLFREPDVDAVRARLHQLADKTGIPVAEVPEFLSKYNDLFVAAGFYRQTFDGVRPEAGRFQAWLEEMKRLPDDVLTRRDRESLDKAAEAAAFITGSIAERLDEIMAGFHGFWENMNRRSLEHLRRQVEDADAATGEILFGFAAKLRAWSNAFPHGAARNGAARVNYLRVMLPGLQRLRDMESEARLLAAHF
jgi:hypothetical protein